jgi:hypothetical protein
MCPMCMMRTALLAVAAVSTGGLATYFAARFGAKKPARDQADCKQCENTKERS